MEVRVGVVHDTMHWAPKISLIAELDTLALQECFTLTKSLLLPLPSLVLAHYPPGMVLPSLWWGFQHPCLVE